MKLNLKKIGNPNNPPLLFLHGFMGRGSDWNEMADCFADKFHCILVDLPGHGDSKNISINTYEGLSKILFNSFEIKEKINVIGYSMGGRLALYLILNFPKAFNKAVIESANPGIKSTDERSKRYKQDLKLLENIKFRTFLQNWYKNPIFGNKLDFQPLIEKKLKNDPTILQESLKLLSVGNQPSLWPKLGSLEVPTLFLSGEKDRKYTQIGREIDCLSPLIKNQVISESGHIIHLEKPDNFKSLVSAFLSN